jgi:5-hydroxyisourate hydrolase/2-oxo-4-hydroxy-4-carboxy-5-ureidoimidazoline decarboxylase
MTLSAFNGLPKDKAAELLLSCCGSSNWVSKMTAAMPFRDEADLVARATEIWYDQCSESDWQDAFSHHPRIGDLASLKEKFASTAHLASGEQSGAAAASEAELLILAKGNEDYEKKFGFIFIVSASGKSALEMIRMIGMRIENSKEEELRVAMGEQQKITLLRLQKQIEGNWGSVRAGQITTHVLDTSLGKPGKGIKISLHDDERCIAAGITNADGRIPDLLPKGRVLSPGVYKMIFRTEEYFRALDQKSFYPMVEIQFEITDATHYHIPLLISPYGFSTYRGS